MRAEIVAPAEVLQDQGRGEQESSLDNSESTSRNQKRKLGNVWLEDARYLYRSGPTGSTVFDTWKWTGEPLKRRRA
jgi:hypothetical protein